jgi:hypothetical protein
VLKIATYVPTRDISQGRRGTPGPLGLFVPARSAIFSPAPQSRRVLADYLNSGMHESGSVMSLATMEWNRVSVHRIILEILIAERDVHVARMIVAAGRMSKAELSTLLDNADLKSPLQNHLRLRMLCLIRSKYIAEFPPDTKWYEVNYLTDDDLSNLHVVGRVGWDHSSDKNELFKVAARRKLEMTEPPSQWKTVILWGHEKTGPFTIAEGNHRLISYASSGGRGLKIPVFVGLSPNPCVYHLLDRNSVVAQDLWRRDI